MNMDFIDRSVWRANMGIKANLYSKSAAFFWMVLVSVFTYAGEPVSTGFFNNVVAGGHDLTAYQALSKTDKAIKGRKSFVVEWKGAKLYFRSEVDKHAFSSNPDAYVPAYNGHCANALSLGEGLVNTNGKHWAVFDGQLYLFYASRGAKRWLEGDVNVYKQVADQAWSAILSEL